MTWNGKLNNTETLLASGETAATQTGISNLVECLKDSSLQRKDRKGHRDRACTMLNGLLKSRSRDTRVSAIDAISQAADAIKPEDIQKLEDNLIMNAGLEDQTLNMHATATLGSTIRHFSPTQQASALGALENNLESQDRWVAGAAAKAMVRMPKTRELMAEVLLDQSRRFVQPEIKQTILEAFKQFDSPEVDATAELGAAVKKHIVDRYARGITSSDDNMDNDEAIHGATYLLLRHHPDKHQKTVQEWLNLADQGKHIGHVERRSGFTTVYGMAILAIADTDTADLFGFRPVYAPHGDDVSADAVERVLKDFTRSDRGVWDKLSPKAAKQYIDSMCSVLEAPPKVDQIGGMDKNVEVWNFLGMDFKPLDAGLPPETPNEQLPSYSARQQVINASAKALDHCASSLRETHRDSNEISPLKDRASGIFERARSMTMTYTLDAGPALVDAVDAVSGALDEKAVAKGRYESATELMHALNKEPGPKYHDPDHVPDEKIDAYRRLQKNIDGYRRGYGVPELQRYVTSHRKKTE